MLFLSRLQPLLSILVIEEVQVNPLGIKVGDGGCQVTQQLTDLIPPSGPRPVTATPSITPLLQHRSTVINEQHCVHLSLTAAC